MTARTVWGESKSNRIQDDWPIGGIGSSIAVFKAPSDNKDASILPALVLILAFEASGTCSADGRRTAMTRVSAYSEYSF